MPLPREVLDAMNEVMSSSPKEKSSVLELSDDDLAFFRMACQLFPTPESPLRGINQRDLLPKSPGESFNSLSLRGIWGAEGLKAEAAARLTSVSECEARVVIRGLPQTNRDSDSRSIFYSQQGRDDYYLAGGMAVGYKKSGSLHYFGACHSEASLAAELALHFGAPKGTQVPKLVLNASEYLVFCVLARDLHDSPSVRTDTKGADSSMSTEEVLAYFDEPETPFVKSNTDDDWQQALNALVKRRVVDEVTSEVGKSHVLNAAYHALAHEVTADTQCTISRFDFLDEQWLVREVSLYHFWDATKNERRVYRLETQYDGSVVIEELDASGLADALCQVVTALPAVLGRSESTISAAQAMG